MPVYSSHVHNQLDDFEFNALTSVGSKLAEKMILQRVRIVDESAQESIIDSAITYVSTNSRKTFYVRKGYHAATIYFEDPIDHEDFRNMIDKYSRK